MPVISGTSLPGLTTSTIGPQPLAAVSKQKVSTVSMPPNTTAENSTSNLFNQSSLSAYVLPGPSKGEFK